METFERTKAFPLREKYAMADQMRRSSRSVCANIAEAWRRRRSSDYFQSKLGEMLKAKQRTPVSGSSSRTGVPIWMPGWQRRPTRNTID